MMHAMRFKRTMARVEDGQGNVLYRCMACVRREVPADKLRHLLAWQDIQTGAGMFVQRWHLMQVHYLCSGCET